MDGEGTTFFKETGNDVVGINELSLKRLIIFFKIPTYLQNIYYSTQLNILQCLNNGGFIEYNSKFQIQNLNYGEFWKYINSSSNISYRIRDFMVAMRLYFIIANVFML